MVFMGLWKFSQPIDFAVPDNTQPSINQGLRGSKTRKNYILAEIPTPYGWEGALTEKRYE